MQSVLQSAGKIARAYDVDGALGFVRRGFDAVVLAFLVEHGLKLGNAHELQMQFMRLRSDRRLQGFKSPGYKRMRLVNLRLALDPERL